MLVVGSLCIVSLVGAEAAWALPHHSVEHFSSFDPRPDSWRPFDRWKPKLDLEEGWGDGGDQYHGWKHEEGPKWFDGRDWKDDKDDYKFHGKHWKYDPKDPDCDPPVSTPEPASLFLVGTSMAGLAVARRLRQRGAGGAPAA
jgi:hypothetical protein